MATQELNKQALKDELIVLLQRDLQSLERAHAATQAAATHEEAKPENDKDTRALEQSYLARGQAQRVLDLRTSLDRIREMPVRQFTADSPIAIGALVTVLEGDEPRVIFMAPEGGGANLAAGHVLVATPRAPFGRALLGKHCGDVCELRAGSRTRELEIVEVR